MLARIYLTLLAAVVFEMESICPLPNTTNILETSPSPMLSITKATVNYKTSTLSSILPLTSSSAPHSSASVAATSSSLSPLEPSFKSQMNPNQNELFHRSPLYTPVTLLGQYRTNNKDKNENTSSSSNDLDSEYIKNLDNFQIQQQQKIRLLQQQQQQQKNMSSSETNVTVQIGNHAYLPCNLRRFMNKPVSWVRIRDEHILTVDQTTFIGDQRFESIYRPDKDFAWSMQIKYVQRQDEGWYECQVSTEPKISTRVYLKVVVPQTEIIGDYIRFVKTGSKVALHCIVRGSLEPPSYIIWSHGNEQIASDNPQGWFMQIDREIFGNSSDQQNTIGSLIIPSVRKKDSGNYTCSPSNSASVTVDLHVLSGEYSASAIMSSGEINKQNYLNLLVFLIVLLYYKT